jgi:hypothetical protein
MRQKQEYYEKELASHGGANKAFDQKVQDWFDDTEPVLKFDGEHPAAIATQEGESTYVPAKGEMLGSWRDDVFYQKVINNEPYGNIWLCMTQQSQPYMTFYHNGIVV